jgi:Na+-driven multidrug efflux pump
MVLFGRQITGLFLSSEAPELVASANEIAYEYLCLLAVMLWILYLLHVYRSVLQGMGDTKIPLVSGIVEFVLRVGMAFGIPLWGFREGVFWAEPLAWLGAVVLLMWAYVCRTRKWK